MRLAKACYVMCSYRGLRNLFCVCVVIVFSLFLFDRFSSVSGKEFEGRSYIDLGTVAKEFGMRSGWTMNGEMYCLRTASNQIDALIDSRCLFINEMPVSLGFRTIKARGRLYLSEDDYKKTLVPLLEMELLEADISEPYRIVLDAAHGGTDTGAVNAVYGLKEKDLSLDICKRLKILLEASGYQVSLTREQDVYLPLKNRSRFANETKADLFLSIHLNAAMNKEVVGIETFVMTPVGQRSTGRSLTEADDLKYFKGNDFDYGNVCFGYLLQKTLVTRMNATDRGLKRARFAVLKDLEMPGLLTELGFLSNSESASRLGNEKTRQLLAEGLLEGIDSYYHFLKIRKNKNLR